MGGPADRVVLYHADAVGMYIWQKYTELFTASHANGPESPAALEKLAVEVDGFDRICKALQKFAGKHRVLYSYSPDHGQHFVPGGSGNHGLMMMEDINILHFLGSV